MKQPLLLSWQVAGKMVNGFTVTTPPMTTSNKLTVLSMNLTCSLLLLLNSTQRKKLRCQIAHQNRQSKSLNYTLTH